MKSTKFIFLLVLMSCQTDDENMEKDSDYIKYAKMVLIIMIMNTQYQ